MRWDWFEKGTGIALFTPLATRPDCGQLVAYPARQRKVFVICLVKAHFDVRALLQVYGLDKPHLPLV